jgi:hypothetical protein
MVKGYDFCASHNYACRRLAIAAVGRRLKKLMLERQIVTLAAIGALWCRAMTEGLIANTIFGGNQWTRPGADRGRERGRGCLEMSFVAAEFDSSHSR